jgi:DNA-binding MarR family transcriptional regulator
MLRFATKGAEKMPSPLSTGALLRDVARLHTHLQRLCVSCCEGTTVTQCTVLTELSRGGPMTLAQLSRRIGLDKSWSSRAVEQLVQEGLVEKVPGGKDRRTVRLSLSNAGVARVQILDQTLNALADQALERIPTKQHASIHQGLALLQQALSELTDEATEKGTDTSLLSKSGKLRETSYGHDHRTGMGSLSYASPPVYSPPRGR